LSTTRKEIMMMKEARIRNLLQTVFIIMVVGGLVILPAAKAVAETITVRCLRPFPWDNPMSVTYREMIKLGNEMGKGRVIFKDIGGSEVYPAFKQLEAVRSGAVDLVHSPGSYHSGEIPENDILFLGWKAPAFRESGLLKIMDRIHREKMGVACIGSGSWYTFNMFTKRPVKTLEDLKGLKLRASPSYVPLAKALGVSTVSMPMGEVYTALETGVVDGACLPSIGNVDYGLHKILRYQVYPFFWFASTHWIDVNAKWFDNLPNDARQIILAVVQKNDEQAYDLYSELEAKDVKLLREAGVEPAILSDKEWFEVQRLKWEAGKERMMKLSPKNAAELLKIAEQWNKPDTVFWPNYDIKTGELKK
jgi:TRAP-type C4-dicarboxylate transport system substrate-binding protein